MKRLTWYRGRYTYEVYLDWTCWMIGVNFCPRRMTVPGIYFHVGPVIAGRWWNYRS